MVTGEILEISLGTPMTPDGLSVLCRRVWSDGMLGPIKLFYLTLRSGSPYFDREWPPCRLGLVIVSVAAAAIEEELNDKF